MFSAVLLACGGFLLAVLWFDLMFDVQVLGAGPHGPEAVASIAAYYRRVTTDAAPMDALVGAVMVIAVLAAVLDVLRDGVCRRVRLLALALVTAPVALAALRVVPNAVALGSGAGTAAERLALAEAILRDHLFCLGAVVAFLALQLHVASQARVAAGVGR